jgi:hypothetical protein
MKDFNRPISRMLSTVCRGLICGVGLFTFPCSVNATSLSASAGVPAKPLSFLENKGQIADQHHNARPDIQFGVSTGSGLTVFVGNGSIHYQFCKTEDAKATVYTMYRMDVELVGADKHAAIIKEQQQNYYENYYTPATGEHGVKAHAYNRVTYKNVYPNIDWVLYSRNRHLKHEFVVRAGGKVSDIKLRYGGATTLHLNADGSLTATTPQGEIMEQAPYAYQNDGKKISSSFVLNGSELSYTTDQYSGELIVDPSLEWATYYGGNGMESGRGVAADVGAANVYLSGYTSSPTAIATSGAYQVSYAGNYDAFVVKLSSGGARQWATYLGGADDDRAMGVAVSPVGVAIAGYTTSAAGIASAWATQYYNAGGTDGFIAQFDISGGLQWSTYSGSTGDDTATDIAADVAGNLFVCGRTNSPAGMSTTGSFQPSYGGAGDAYLSKINSSGGPLWSTYYGGGGVDMASAVHVDGFGNVLVAGQTSSGSAIATMGSYQTLLSGANDAFVVKFANDGTQMWGTYYGGTGDETGTVGTDIFSNVYLAGSTTSYMGLATTGAFKDTCVSIDAYVVKFTKEGARVWGTYYGGNDSTDIAMAVTGDGGGNVYIGGVTYSSEGIGVTGAHQDSYSGFGDGFVAKFNTVGTPTYRTFYGGALGDRVYSMLADAHGNLYIAGETESPNRISTFGGHQWILGGGSDAFLSKIKEMWTLDVTAPLTGETLRVYPNPTTGAFAVMTSCGGTLTLYGIEGRSIMQAKLEKGTTTLALPQGTAAGIYFGRYAADDGNGASVQVVVTP